MTECTEIRSIATQIPLRPVKIHCIDIISSILQTVVEAVEEGMGDEETGVIEKLLGEVVLRLGVRV